MQKNPDPVSIEYSNLWFFIIVASFALPGLLFQEIDLPLVYVAMLAGWSMALLPIQLRHHRENMQWVSSLDEKALNALWMKSKSGSYYHRLSSSEKEKRDYA